METFKKSQKYPGYLIFSTGEIRDEVTQRTIEPVTIRGSRHVRISHGGKKIVAEVARMVLHAFSPLQSPTQMDRVWRHEYLDGDKWNSSIVNLRWVGPAKPIPHPVNDQLFFIPEYTGYLLSKDGKVVQAATGREIKPSYLKEGYACCSMMSDRGKYGSVNLHRLMLLTFKPIFFNGNKWIVNHLKGDKWLHSLGDLEWTDYSGNILHAYNTGLRNDNRPVKLYDILTGKEELFYSMADCARRFNKKTERIWDYLHNQPGKIRFDHYLLKWADDQSTWEPFTESDCFIPDNGRPKPMLLKNLSTGQVIEVASATEAAKVTGIKMATVRYYVTNRIPRAKEGWMFKDLHDKTPWLEGNGPARVYKKGKPPERKLEYCVHNTLTGETVRIKGMDKVCDIIGLDARTIRYHLRRAADGKSCKHFIIEKVA